MQLLRILFIELVRPKFPADDLDRVLKDFVKERLLPWNEVIMNALSGFNNETGFP
jgi:hypothetical protein